MVSYDEALTAPADRSNVTYMPALAPADCDPSCGYPDSRLSLAGGNSADVLIVGGGFLVGFGTRYAGGCTSGHAIMGLSTLQWPSLVATMCFMAGGFLMANVFLPLILKL